MCRVASVGQQAAVTVVSAQYRFVCTAVVTRPVCGARPQGQGPGMETETEFGAHLSEQLFECHGEIPPAMRSLMGLVLEGEWSHDRPPACLEMFRAAAI